MRKLIEHPAFWPAVLAFIAGVAVTLVVVALLSRLFPLLVLVAVAMAAIWAWRFFNDSPGDNDPEG